MTELLSSALADAAVAIPRLRVPGRTGAVATAWFDEDATTLAAQAAMTVLDRQPEHRPRALLVATVSSPLAEGGIGQVVAELLGVASDDLLIQEFAGTAAAGGAALVSALALSSAGIAPVLVVAADTRRDPRGRALGDAGVALLIDPGGTVASVTYEGSSARLLRDRWRRDGAAHVESADGSFLRTVPPSSPVPDPAVVVTPDTPRVDRVGLAGCAAFPLALLLALAEGGRLSAVVAAGGVAHAFTLAAGTTAAEVGEAVAAEVAGGVEGAAPRPPSNDGFDPYASQPRSYRERAQDLSLVGQRDLTTGEVLFPPIPVASGRNLMPHRLSRRGTVLTTTRDHLFPYGAPLSMAVVALDGGGRFFGQVVDGQEVTIGQPVRLVPRRLHDGGGLPHYFWKVQPDGVRTAAGTAAS